MKYLHINKEAVLGTDLDAELANIRNDITVLQSTTGNKYSQSLKDFELDLTVLENSSNKHKYTDVAQSIKDRISLLKVIIELKDQKANTPTGSSDTSSEENSSTEPSDTSSEGIQNPKYYLSEKESGGYPIPDGKDGDMLISYLERAYSSGEEVETYVSSFPFIPSTISIVNKKSSDTSTEENTSTESSDTATDQQVFYLQFFGDKPIYDQLLTALKGIPDDKDGMHGIIQTLTIPILENYPQAALVVAENLTTIDETNTKETEDNKKLLYRLVNNLGYCRHGVSQDLKYLTEALKVAIDKNNKEAFDIIFKSTVTNLEDYNSFVINLLEHAVGTDNKNTEIILELLNKLKPSTEFRLGEKSTTVGEYVVDNNILKYSMIERIDISKEQITKITTSGNNGMLDKIAEKIDPSLKYDTNGNNLFHLAAQSNNPDILDTYLKKCNYETFMGVLGINDKNNNGKTPLMLAIEKGSLEAVQVLAPKSDLTISDKDRNNPIHLAMLNDNNKALFELITSDFGKDDKAKTDKQKEIGSAINTKNKYGKTPLMIAIENGNFDAVKVLAPKSDLTIYDKNGNNPIHLAAMATATTGDDAASTPTASAGGGTTSEPDNRTAILNELLNANTQGWVAKNSPEWLDKSTGGALSSASISPINKINTAGKTPYHLAVESKNIETVKALEKNNADITKTTSDKFGALHLLVQAGTSDHDLMQHLTNKEELIKVQDGDNRTPLFYAKSADVIKTLIQGGIDPNHNDKHGFNALNHVLKFKGKQKAEVVTALLGAGSNIDQISKAWGSNIDLIGQKKEDIKLDKFSEAIKQENVRTKIERKIDNTHNIREFNSKYRTNLNSNKIYLEDDLRRIHSELMEQFNIDHEKELDINKMYTIAEIKKLSLSDDEKEKLMPLASENYMQAIETITYDASEFEIREKAQLKREHGNELQAKNLDSLAENIKEAKQIIYDESRTEDDKVRDLLEKNKSYQMPRVQLELERSYRSKKLIEHEKTKFAKEGRMYTALKELANYKKDDKHAPKNITKGNFSTYLGKTQGIPPKHQNPNLIIKHTDGVIKIYTDDFKIKITNQDKCEIKRYGGSYKTLEDANNYLSHIIGTESHPHPNSPAYIDKQESFPDHDRILFHDSYGNFKLESGKTDDIDGYIAMKYPEIDFSGFSQQQKVEIVYKHQQDMFHTYADGNLDKIEKVSISNDFPERNTEILDEKAWDSLSQIAYEHNYHLNLDRLDKIKDSYNPKNPNPRNAFLTSNSSYINAKKTLKEIHEGSVNRAKNVMKMHPQGVITLSDFLNERTSKNEKPIWMSDDVTTLNDNGTVTLDYAKYKLSKSEKEQLKEYPDDMRLLGKKNRYEALKALNGKNITKDKHKLAATRYLGSYTSAAYNSKAIKDLDKMMPVESSEHSDLAHVKENDKVFLNGVANEDTFNIMASLGINETEYAEMTCAMGLEVKSGMLYELSFKDSAGKVKAALELIADTKEKKTATKELDKEINDINAKTLTEAEKIQELNKYITTKIGRNNTDPINIRYKDALNVLNSHKAVKIANKSDWFSLNVPAAHLASCIVRDTGEPDWLPHEWKSRIDISKSTYDPSTHELKLVLDGAEHKINITDSKSISDVFGPKLIYGTPEENGIKLKIKDRLDIDENEYAQLTNTMGFEVKTGGMIRTTTSISSTYYSFNDSAEKVKAALELIADTKEKNTATKDLYTKITEINGTTNTNVKPLTEAEKIQKLETYLEGKKGTDKNDPKYISYTNSLNALNSHKAVKIANKSDWFSLNVPAAHLASCIVRGTGEPKWLPHEWKSRIDISNSTYDPSTHEITLHLKDAPKHPITIDITHSKSISDVFGENMVYRVANKESIEYKNSDYAKCSLEKTPDIIFIRDHTGKMKNLKEIDFDLYTGKPNYLKNTSFSFDSFCDARSNLSDIGPVISFQKYLEAAARSATPRVNIYDISFDQLVRQVESILDKVITDPDKEVKIASVRGSINVIKEGSDTDKISIFLQKINDSNTLTADDKDSIQKCIPEISATKRLEIAKAINNTALIKECNLMTKDCYDENNISDQTWGFIGADKDAIEGMTRIKELAHASLDTILEKGYMLNNAADEMLLISRLIKEGMTSYNIDNRIKADNITNRNKALDSSNDENPNQFLRPAYNIEVKAQNFRSYRELFDYLSASKGSNYNITKFKNDHKEIPASYSYLQTLLEDYSEAKSTGDSLKAKKIMDHIETFGQILGSEYILKLKQSDLSVPAAKELINLININDLDRFNKYCEDTADTSHLDFIREAEAYISQETEVREPSIFPNFNFMYFFGYHVTPQDTRCINKEDFTRINEVLSKLNTHDRILEVKITPDGKDEQSLKKFLTERIESFTEEDQKLAEDAILETYTESTTNEIRDMFRDELDTTGLEKVKEKITKFEKESGNTQKLSTIKERIDLLSETKQKILTLKLEGLDIIGDDFDKKLEEKIKEKFKSREADRFTYNDTVGAQLSFSTHLGQLYTEIKGTSYADKFPETETAIIDGTENISAIFKVESHSNIATCLQAEDPKKGIAEARNIANIEVQQLGIDKDKNLLDLLVDLQAKINMTGDIGIDLNLVSFSKARNSLAGMLRTNLNQLELKQAIAETKEIIKATEEKIKMAPLRSQITQLQKSVDTLNQNDQVNNTKLGELQESVESANSKINDVNTSVSSMEQKVTSLTTQHQNLVSDTNQKLRYYSSTMSNMAFSLRIINNSLLGLDQTQQQIAYQQQQIDQQQQQIAGQANFLDIAENFQVRIAHLEGMQQQGNQIDERIEDLSNTIAARVIDIMREANPNQDDELTSLKAQIEMLKADLESHHSREEEIAQLEKFKMFVLGIKITPEGKSIQDFLIEEAQNIELAPISVKGLENIKDKMTNLDSDNAFIKFCTEIVKEDKVYEEQKIKIINNLYKNITGNQTDLISKIDDLKNFHNRDLDHAISDPQTAISSSAIDESFSTVAAAGNDPTFTASNSNSWFSDLAYYFTSYEEIDKRKKLYESFITKYDSLFQRNDAILTKTKIGRNKISKSENLYDLIYELKNGHLESYCHNVNETEIKEELERLNNLYKLEEIKNRCTTIDSYDTNHIKFKEATKKKAYEKIFEGEGEGDPSTATNLSDAIFTKIELLSADPNSNVIDLYSRADIETKVALFEIELNNTNTYSDLTHDQEIYSEIYKEILSLPIDETEKETLKGCLIADNNEHKKQIFFPRDRSTIVENAFKDDPKGASMIKLATDCISELESKFSIKLVQVEKDEISTSVGELYDKTNVNFRKDIILQSLQQGRNTLYLLDKSFHDKNIPNLTEKIKKINPYEDYSEPTQYDSLLKEFGIDDPHISRSPGANNSR